MNPVVHFESPYEDRDRMAKFYSGVFGWKFQMMGADMGNYAVAHTDETDANGMLKQSNRINGGFYKKTDDASSHAPSFVIAVDNLADSIEKVKAAGGQIMSEKPEEIPGIGLWVSCKDTEGTRFSMLQPKNAMG